MKKIKQKIRKIAALFITAVLLSTSLVFSNEVTFTGMVQIGTPVQLLPIITPSNAANTAVKFSSNIPSVASVDSLTGVVTGKFPGLATITATTADGNFKAIYKAIVYETNLILPSVISNNMVIQQNMQAALWGWGPPNENVQITASWGQTAIAISDTTGKWSTKIQTPKAVAGDNQTKHTLTFSGKNNTITLSNILIGDVYLCSGQSNMAFEMTRLLDGINQMATANYPNIRLNEPNFRPEYVPFYNGVSSWKECNTTNVSNFSAVAYYFARQLYTNPNINIPIGLIAPAVPASGVQSWISRASLSADPELKSNVLDVYDLNPILDHQTASSVLYNGMIASLIPFNLKGFLWYQGETNNSITNYRDLYSKLMSTLITSWRAEWGQGNLPFYFVQLPAYNGFAPELRDQQTNTLTVPNTGMAVTLDLADANLNEIHPQNKKDVGIRLAKIAEAKIYNQNVVFAGPMLQSFTIEGDKIRIKYDALSVGSGLDSRDGQALTNFQIVGSNGRPYTATAVIDGNDVLVSSTFVSSPTNVYFAYTPAAIPNLMNKEGLTACPFRTDRWNYNITLGAENPNALNKNVGEKLIVFPVPVDAKLYVKFTRDTKIASFMITDITGKIHSKSNYEVFDGNQCIDVSNLIRGYYILQLNFGNYVQSVPFIKS